MITIKVAWFYKRAFDDSTHYYEMIYYEDKIWTFFFFFNFIGLFLIHLIKLKFHHIRRVKMKKMMLGIWSLLTMDNRLDIICDWLQAWFQRPQFLIQKRKCGKLMCFYPLRRWELTRVQNIRIYGTWFKFFF